MDIYKNLQGIYLKPFKKKSDSLVL